jgi:pimeloyl-ACP methyl ester carboxylesterase
VELSVEDYGGKGPDLLLLHGGADNVETWRELVRRLPRFRIAAYDARGHGESPTPEKASVAQMVADVFAVVDHLGFDRPLLVGHSMGGINALLAAAEEDRFAGVVALDAVPRWWSRPDLTREEFEEIGRARKVDWRGTPDELEREFAAIVAGKQHAELIRAVLRRNHELDGDGLLRRKPHPAFALRLAQIYQSPESGLTLERIEATRCPVILLCSESWVQGSEVRRTLAGLPPLIRVEWLGTRHHLHWDHPDEVANRIKGLA